MTKLILTEKKDQAVKISKIMGWKQSQGCFEGTFEGEPVKVVHARGHLTTLLDPNEVVEGLGWNKPQDLIPIPRSVGIKISPDIKGTPPGAQPRQYVKNIKQHSRGISELIIATDSDREGEAIGWNLIRLIGYKGPVRRAWLAAGLDKKSITEAFGNLREPQITKSWYRASEARNQSDWATMFIVRAYTHFASYGVFGKYLGRGNNARSRVMSVGRVQTSALSMLVRREIEIRDFVSRDHYKIIGNFSDNNVDFSAGFSPIVTSDIIFGKPEGVIWEPSKSIPEDGKPEPLDTPLFVGKEQVDAFKQRLFSAGTVKITSYKERSRKENAPKTFSLTDAQSVIGKKLSISAPLVQTILEDLYEQGWTSYARTSKSEIPINFYEDEERNGLLENLSALSEISTQAKEAKSIHDGTHLNIKPFTPPVFTKKPLEHHGIVPTHQNIDDSKLSGFIPRKSDKGRIRHTSDQMRETYFLIAKQYVQALFPSAAYAVQDLIITADTSDILGSPTSRFKTKGERMTNPGWRAAFSEKPDKDTTLPVFKEGQSVDLSDVELKPTKTKPPSRFNEKTFPKAMETVGKEVSDPNLRKRLKNSEGIGTPATRKTIIETLLVREYVSVKGGSYFASPKGEELINSVPAWLKTPETTALWEDYLVKLCEEKSDDKAIEMRDLFINKQICNMEKLITILIDSYSKDLGEKLKTVNAPKKVSDKMKTAIIDIEKRKGISAPRGALTKPEIASAFLNEHIGNRDKNDNSPSESQINYARSLASNLPESIRIPEDAYTDRKACSEFIKMAKKYAPPTDGQLSFAKKLWHKLPENDKPSEDLFNSAVKCSNFIDEQTKDWKKKESSQSKRENLRNRT